MKNQLIITGLCLLFPLALGAEEVKPEEAKAKHQEGSAKVANEQDELSADVEQLATEQTIPKVIQLLNEVEDIMDEATENLAKSDTGGGTLAAQTEIIEKIHAAAKEKQSNGSCKSGSAMMDMMERMMGKKPDGEKNQLSKGGKSDDKKGGGGVTGESDSGNEAAAGAAGGNTEQRRVPKAAGTAGAEIPGEFRKAFDAYNRGAEKKVK